VKRSAVLEQVIPLSRQVILHQLVGRSIKASVEIDLAW